ncbi:MAG: type IV pilus modification protein PilV [Spongiibacteraceae bacterium]|nr:type IV pilus modification protein PilV [Spongiibacteraceae bacterium]
MIKDKQSGMTLIEVLITLFIMAIGLLGLAGLQSASIKDGLDTAKRSQVTWLVSELVERMRANPGGQATGYTSASGTTCAAIPEKRCSHNSAGTAATDCTPNEMATYDVWEVFCGMPETGVMANSPDVLNLESITISCGGACTSKSDYTVSISWTTQSVENSQLLTDDKKDEFKSQNITMVVRP